MTLTTTPGGLQLQSITSDQTGANIADFPLGPNMPSGTFAIGGTLTSLTLTFYASVDGQTFHLLGVTKVSDQTTVSTTTATGLFSFTNTGFAVVRVKCTTYSSGNCAVQLGTGLW